MIKEVQKRVSPGSKVLDAGCGAGAMSLLLAEAGYRVEAVDAAWNAEMEDLNQHVDNVNYTLLNMCFEALPFPKGGFQAIVCLEVMEHLRNPWAFIEAASQVLAGGGWLFVSIPNYWNLKYRIRYLLTGNIQQPFHVSTESIKAFRSGSMPHINTIPWPVLKYALEAYDFDVVESPVSEKLYSVKRNIPLFPLVLMIKSIQLARRKKQKKYLTQETNSYSILLGGPHVFITAYKRSF
jgi:SAM-dependent methyltransferase